MKYVSIDIETTGLDKDKNQILEVGAVLDELGSDTPVEDLPKFRAVIIHEQMQINAYCADLHKDLWPEIIAAKLLMKDFGGDNGVLNAYRLSDGGGIEPLRDNFVSDHLRYNDITKETAYSRPFRFEDIFFNWLRCALLNMGESRNRTAEKIEITVAGKNAGSFDVPFIEALPNWQGLVKFRRRTLDPASHFVIDSDECLPDLQTCLNRAGILSTVSHTAVDDAIDVVKLVRHIRAERSFYQKQPENYCDTCIDKDTCTKTKAVRSCGPNVLDKKTCGRHCTKAYIKGVCNVTGGPSDSVVVESCVGFNPL